MPATSVSETDEPTKASSLPDPHPELVDIQDSMLDGLGQLASYFGFNKIIGQLYAFVLFEPQPLSLDQLRERLHISKAAVSMHMRTLEQLGMVRQVYMRGEQHRRKFYEAETDLWQIIRNIISLREKRDIDRTLIVLRENVERLLNLQPELAELDHQRARFFLERTEQMESLFRFAHNLINTMLEESDLTQDFSTQSEKSKQGRGSGGIGRRA